MTDDKSHTIRVAPASGAYDVIVAPAVLRSLGGHVRRVAPSRRAHVIADGAIPEALLDLAVASLRTANYAVGVSRTHADEPHKSLDAAGALLADLLRAGHERADPVISLGGGIVTDLAGFVAAAYRRGVPVVHCPTTLLAMVDAAVGGKTGVNLPLPDGSLAKNMVGAFWQPRLVLCDPDALRTLPARQLRAGMAECLKHALLAAGLAGVEGGEGAGGRDPELWRWTLDHLDGVLRLDPAATSELIARNIRVKAAVVSADEREEAPSSAGGRALLNLGHTYAHAVETLEGLEPVGWSGGPPSVPDAGRETVRFMLHHGEAVGLGLIAAARASARAGWLSRSDAESVGAAVARAGLPTAVRGLPSNESLRERMMHDKKTTAGALRLILLKSLGEAAVVERPDPAVVDAGWDAVRG